MPAKAPASRNVLLRSSHLTPRSCPLRHGRTLTSEPLSTKPSARILVGPFTSVSGNDGRPLAEYGKSIPLLLRLDLFQFSHQGFSRTRFKCWCRDSVGPAQCHRPVNCATVYLCTKQ